MNCLSRWNWILLFASVVLCGLVVVEQHLGAVTGFCFGFFLAQIIFKLEWHYMVDEYRHHPMKARRLVEEKLREQSK